MRGRLLPERVAATSAAIAATLVAGLAAMHVRMVLSPAPQEMREGAAVWLTELLLEGRDIYDIRELPASTNVYGIFYHLVVWPFARVFGNGFEIHRAVSGAAIAIASVLMFRILRRRGADWLLATVGALLFYVSSVYFVGPLARPDGLAVFLSVASIFVLFEKTLTPLRVGCGVALALLALATKIPLAFPPFVLAAYVFLFQSPRRGLQLGIVTLTASVVVLLLLNRMFATYLNLSLVTNSNANYDGGMHLLTQTRDWLLFSLPLPVALIAGIAVRTRGRASAGRPIETSAHGRSPVFMFAERPSVFAFASVANAVVFAGWLGWHPGAHMTYLFQLVTPVLIPALLPGLTAFAWPRALASLALPVALVMNAHYFPLDLQRFEDAEATFESLEGEIRSHTRVLGSTDVAGLLAEADQQVVDSGQSEYFAFASAEHPFPGLVPAVTLRTRWNEFMSRLTSQIAGRQYDLVIRSRKWGLIPEDVVADHYRVARTVDVDFAWTGQHWPLDLWERRLGNEAAAKAGAHD